MANDGSLLSKLEQFVADTLAALTSGGSVVFKTADVWKHQVSGTNAGIEAFERYAPFAFCSRADVGAYREGGYDLRQGIGLSIVIGQTSKSNGVARCGNSKKLGTNKFRELVIDALEKTHPGDGYGCDSIFYDGEFEVLDAPKAHAIQINFKVNKL